MQRKDRIRKEILITGRNKRLGNESTQYRKMEQTEDSRNRDDVIRKICTFLKEGLSIDEACRRIANDEQVKKQFEYLTKLGIDLETSFKAWYEGRAKKKNTFTYENEASQEARKDISNLIGR